MVEEDADVTPWEARDGLLECFVEYLVACDRAACEYTIYHGDQHLPAANCDCICAAGYGQAWIRLVRYNRDLTRTELTSWGGGCGYSVIATFEAGLHRCITAIQTEAAAPTPAQYTTDAHAADEDMAVLMSLMCCPIITGDDERDALAVRDWDWRPLSPRGGCDGQVLTFQVSGLEIFVDGADTDGTIGDC
jgi:hypothetical protein